MGWESLAASHGDASGPAVRSRKRGGLARIGVFSKKLLAGAGAFFGAGTARRGALRRLRCGMNRSMLRHGAGGRGTAARWADGIQIEGCKHIEPIVHYRNTDGNWARVRGPDEEASGRLRLWFEAATYGLGVARPCTTLATRVGSSSMPTEAWPMVVGRTQRMRPFWTFLSRSMASRTWAGSTPV